MCVCERPERLLQPGDDGADRSIVLMTLVATIRQQWKNCCYNHSQIFPLHFILYYRELNALLFIFAFCRIWKRCTLCVIHQTCNCTIMAAHQPIQNCFSNDCEIITYHDLQCHWILALLYDVAIMVIYWTCLYGKIGRYLYPQWHIAWFNYSNKIEQIHNFWGFVFIWLPIIIKSNHWLHSIKFDFQIVWVVMSGISSFFLPHTYKSLSHMTVKELKVTSNAQHIILFCRLPLILN